ncbi:MAG: hypothetical protein J6Z50_08155 [Fibrobacterales bacterium]|nr:hypothetical protein [Fibrobacterales bacterium]
MKSAFFRRLLLALLLGAVCAQAQIVGFGAATEILQDPGAASGADVRVTPHIMAAIPKWGMARLEFAVSAWDLESSAAEEHVDAARWGLHLGVNAGLLPGESYALLGWRHVRLYDDSPAGDSEWNELGVGCGSLWRPATGLGLFAEIEHAWSIGERRPDPRDEIDVERRGWQIQLGFVAFVR